MSVTPDLQTRIDSYLMKLRRALRGLPQEDIAEILREIRGHILDRADAAGELTSEQLVAILKELGRPEDIAPLYHAESLVTRARSSFSPLLMLRTTMRWAMLSVSGFTVFLFTVLGYALAFGFFGAAVLKPFLPNRVGAWVEPGVGFTVGMVSHPNAGVELLGWWFIPVALLGGSICLVATTRVVRWALQWAVKSPVITPAIA